MTVMRMTVLRMTVLRMTVMRMTAMRATATAMAVPPDVRRTRMMWPLPHLCCPLRPPAAPAPHAAP
eukprot:gene14147-18767_t